MSKKDKLQLALGEIYSDVPMRVSSIALIKELLVKEIKKEQSKTITS